MEGRFENVCQTDFVCSLTNEQEDTKTYSSKDVYQSHSESLVNVQTTK